MSIRPLVDLDSLVYRVGFATKEDEPLEHSLHNVKKTLSGILEGYDCDDPLLVLSGKGNFRNDYCKVLPQVGPKNKDGTSWIYKGNRVGTRKPIHYEEIRDYLIGKWKAHVTDNEEADDFIACTQYCAESESTCIVAQDKDFKTIHGFHHNWVTNKKFNVSKHSADLFFLYQVIMGDRTDHIPGITGYGDKKASGIIKENDGNISKIKRVIVSLYKKEYGDVWREVLDEVSTLLFLKREEGKTYADYLGGW